ncbi:MAG TPA: hypothetical protein VM935_02450 [Chitinophagaceae bacterium]|nr:hypothetical protein [Chitinophagaceae bacterium]
MNSRTKLPASKGGCGCIYTNRVAYYTKQENECVTVLISGSNSKKGHETRFGRINNPVGRIRPSGDTDDIALVYAKGRSHYQPI